MAFGLADLHPLKLGMTVEVANTTSAIREAQALRHQVFCLERRLWTPDRVTNLEQDAFDAAAKHVVVRRRSDREVIATSRVIGIRTVDQGTALPMLRYCCPSVLDGLPMDSVGEVSRFAISKQTRGTETKTGPALRLLLLHGILQASQHMRLTHWCALMDPSLMRLLSLTGVNFSPIGPLVECYGLRQPCVARIDAVVSGSRHSHPHYYQAIAERYRLAA